jgi:hypothetical protein
MDIIFLYVGQMGCGLFTNCFIYTYYLFPWLFSFIVLIITKRELSLYKRFAKFMRLCLVVAATIETHLQFVEDDSTFVESKKA